MNGKSIMGVMMLAAECGVELIVRADGADAQQALDALADAHRATSSGSVK